MAIIIKSDGTLSKIELPHESEERGAILRAIINSKTIRTKITCDPHGRTRCIVYRNTRFQVPMISVFNATATRIAEVEIYGDAVYYSPDETLDLAYSSMESW